MRVIFIADLTICGAWRVLLSFRTRHAPRFFMKFFTSLRGRAPGYQAQLRLFLLPYLVGTFVLVGLPALFTIGMAFTEFNGVARPQWDGLRNFQRLWESPVVRLSLRNSLIFLLLAVPLRLLAALGLALLLQRKERLFGFYRAAIYLPTVIPEAAYALLWLWIFNPFYGPLNMMLGAIGLPTPDWLGDPNTAILAIVLMSCFQIGEGFIVLIAGLQNIPRALYEAATVDGASNWQAFWRITLPLIFPWMLLLTVRDIVMSLQNTFAPTYILTYGGPYYATTFVPLLIYELAFDLFDFGLAAALMVITYLILGWLIMGLVNAVGGWRRDHES